MKFVTLISFTEQGLQNIKNTTQRATEFKQRAERLGVEIRELLWLSGRYDGLVVFDAPDCESASALMLQLSSFGNVKTETLQAFDSSGMDQVLAKVKSS